jgi:hypothetical protein
MDCRCEHGKHKGTPWRKVPDDYLKWIIEVNHSQAKNAKEALTRRVIEHVEVILSPLVIDRASLYLNATWQRNHNRNEGIYS